MKTIEVKILHLPLKAKWFKMQESGEKPEEYREITPYWCKRLLGRERALYSYRNNYQSCNVKGYTHVAKAVHSRNAAADIDAVPGRRSEGLAVR